MAADNRVDNRRRYEINLLIVAAHAGYHTQAPQGEAMAVAIEVWKDALDAAGVPSEQLRPMLTRANTGRGSNYPPSVAEIVAQWQKFQCEQPRPTFQESEAARVREVRGQGTSLPEASESSRGRSVWKQLGERLQAGRGNVLCECGLPAKVSAHGFDWICSREKCSFVWPTCNTLDAPQGGDAGPLGVEEMGAGPLDARVGVEGAEGDSVPLPEVREYSEEELLEELVERCEFNVERVGREVALQFALHLKSIAPVAVWTGAIARGQWGKWGGGC